MSKRPKHIRASSLARPQYALQRSLRRFCRVSYAEHVAELFGACEVTI